MAGSSGDEARRKKRWHLARVFFWWVLAVPLIFLLGLENSVLVLIVLSCYANGAADLSSWQGVDHPK